MAQNDALKRYLDAGLALTALTQARAEALVKDLVKAGEVQADQAREAVADLLDRSRQNTEKLLETVRHEVKAQITGLGLASKDDVERVEQRLLRLFGAGPGAASGTTAAKKAPAKKAAAKKAPAKKTAAKKTTSSGAKKTAKKASARSSAAKKA
jgi:polyhydroxyalkanoate synthesis regulator phasin